MQLTHPKANWQLNYDDELAAMPTALTIDGRPICSELHNAIDGVTEAHARTEKTHHYRKGGCALYEAAAVFPNGARLQLTTRTAGNCQRQTNDLTWPQKTSLHDSLELGSARLDGAWKRCFAIMQGDDLQKAPAWRDLPQEEKASLTFDALPAALVLENADGLRLEVGLGDDLWRWQKAMNGAYLSANQQLIITRHGDGLDLRRLLVKCDPKAEEAAAAERTRLAQAAAEKKRAAEMARRRAEGEEPAEEEEAQPDVESPVSQPEGRPYRFESYLAWSANTLATGTDAVSAATAVPLNKRGALDRADLEKLGAEPALALDLTQLPLAKENCRPDGLPCWKNRRVQTLYRHIIRQLAAYAPKGILRIDGGFAPGWCDCGRHVSRSGTFVHWDHDALVEAAVWTRQILGDEWIIAAPQSGTAAEMPSLQALFAPTGFRGAAADDVADDDGDNEAQSPEA